MDKRLIEVAEELGVEVGVVEAYSELYQSEHFSRENLYRHFVEKEKNNKKEDINEEDKKN